MASIIDKTVTSKYQPKSTNVIWVDTSYNPPVEKHFVNGKWKSMGGGVSDYSDIKNKPTINGVELDGNKTSQDLGVYSKPSTGIPQSDLSSDVQSQLNKHFKGWYYTLTELKAAHTATEGDSAYVKDASPATTWSIYVYDATATTDNYWADSGTNADTSNVQTFASGEEVNEVHIVNNLTTGGSEDVASAEMVAVLKEDSSDIVFNYPVTAGGSNGKTFSVCLQPGSYTILINPGNTGNTGTFNIYPTPSGTIIGGTTGCVIGMERGVVVTSKITTINIGDINSSITTSGDMSLVIRKLDSLSSRIRKNDNVQYNFSDKFYGTFVNGTLSSGAYGTYRVEYRCCSLDIMKYDRDIFVKAKPGYKFGIQKFTSAGVYSSDSGWQTSYKITAGTYFKAVITTTNDNVKIGPDVALANVVISTLLDEKTGQYDNSLSVVGTGQTGIKTNVNFPSKKVKIKIPNPWPITNVGQDGNNVLCIGYDKGGTSYDIQALAKYEMDARFEKEFVVVFPDFSYDSTYIFLRADSGSTAYIEFEEYHDYDKIDSGRNYEGEIVYPKSRFALSQIGQLKYYGAIDQTTITAQGMAVYNDRYILQGSNKIGVGSHLLVVDTKTPSISTLTIETLSSGQGFHMNNINLGQKYDDTDILPLVYCSEFYNQHTCKVIRIANDFGSFTEIQSISYSGDAIDTSTYDWVLDADKGLLYLISFPTSGIKMLCFNLPNTSSASVTLTDADVVKTINIANTSGKTILSQGGTIINGKLWTVFGSDNTTYPGFLVVSDIEKEEMVSFADLSGLGEAEAVAPYKEGVLLCVAYGLVSIGASLSNPSYVYMIFNN